MAPGMPGGRTIDVNGTAQCMDGQEVGKEDIGTCLPFRQQMVLERLAGAASSSGISGMEPQGHQEIAAFSTAPCGRGRFPPPGPLGS